MNSRTETAVGVTAFVSGLILFISLVGYADSKGEAEPTSPTTSVATPSSTADCVEETPTN